METAVQIVRAYLQLNGYFTICEFPVVERSAREGRYSTATDIDVLALRFPHAIYEIPFRARGRGRRAERSRPHPGALHLDVDPALEVPSDRLDMIIGEVKHGRAEVNPRLRDPLVLETAVSRTGCCPPSAIEGTVERLIRRGRAELDHGPGRKCRVRLMAFGGVESGPGWIETMSLQQSARYIQEHLCRYARELKPARFGDPMVDLFQLLQKLGLLAGDELVRGAGARRGRPK